ncbi:hypothetical protein OUZ56_020497 [Daphnia magna]|uniref:Fibrillar collagen NC1 domain-containing protein n=1 Tax=Daphnia magna TaxID=35525 RepID=A0ABQ9ZEM4_9CRUS|nr:hypothetical protein OUZ56_020497 [Daphnia magna]
MYWIDPDGQGVGDDPIYVFCNMTTGSTSVPHDSESPMDVGHCADPAVIPGKSTTSPAAGKCKYWLCYLLSVISRLKNRDKP